MMDMMPTKQGWKRLQIPESGAAVYVPSFLTEDLGKPYGYGVTATLLRLPNSTWLNA